MTAHEGVKLAKLKLSEIIKVLDSVPLNSSSPPNMIILKALKSAVLKKKPCCGTVLETRVVHMLRVISKIYKVLSKLVVLPITPPNTTRNSVKSVRCIVAMA